MDIILILLTLMLPIIADLNIRLNYNKYLKEYNKKELTGAEVARMILEKHNLKDIYVVETSGYLSDHYDPTRKVVRLSAAVYNKATVASVAIAAHECGHAIQDKEGYKFMRFRSAIFPFVNITTSLSYWIILIGLFLGILKVFYIGIAFTCIGLLFQLVTLPVEFDASKRAKEELKKLKVVNKTEEKGIAKVLKSAALTYVAGVLASILQIVRLLLLANNNRD